ncbi:hypothetical protein [Stenotrophomonas sp. GD03657]|uniref:hypothetical protein n=1 Tax=Stenotrophomonas sp. GD03657 TaxID=2975363 RepID=UPI00244A0A26|nr:hypothetical protein [Stenotrophomonas sp. GD03657]MDH2154159.1 hypothetical protein [Stenotrophomonas sp. GD03657]
MSTELHYMIDLEGKTGPTTNELAVAEVESRDFARFLPLPEHQYEQNREVLQRESDRDNVWGLTDEDGSLVLIEKRDSDLDLEQYKATSLAFIHGSLAAIYFQEQAEIAFGLAEGVELHEDADEVHAAFYSLPFEVADHEFAHGKLSENGLKVKYDPNSPKQFTVSAGFVPGLQHELVKLFTSVLAEGKRASLVTLMINKTNPEDSSESLMVICHDGSVESTSLRDLGDLLLTSPWNPSATELVEADKEIDRLRNRT